MNFGYGLPHENKYEALTRLFWTALVQFIRMGFALKPIHAYGYRFNVSAPTDRPAVIRYLSLRRTITNQVSVQAPLPVKISDGFCSLMFISNVDGDGLLSYF